MRKLFFIFVALLATITLFANGYVSPISVTDGTATDWDALPAEYVASATHTEGCSYDGLKSVKVYCDDNYLNILVEVNLDVVTDLLWTPFRIFLNADGSADTGGYGDLFADADTEWMLETAIYEYDYVNPYNPAVFNWWGEVGGNGWQWTDPEVEITSENCWGAIVCEGSYPAVGTSQMVDGDLSKVEIQILKELIPAQWADEFTIGFEIQQKWTSCGILPNAADDKFGNSVRAEKLKVKVYHPSTIDTPTPPESDHQTEGIGVFSISEGKTVTFSPGNLQYHPANDEWRFAENQTDYIGSANSNISATYSGWLDLFGWGTGDVPTKSSESYSDYKTFVDWGTNKISNDAPNTWRTLSNDEWGYIFYNRPNAQSLFALGSVNGVNGTIILPDNWTTPVGVSFVASTTKGLYWNRWYYYNSNDNNFSHNTYTSEQWVKMEQEGAVFLPASGNRWGTSVTGVGNAGYYWSTTEAGMDYAHYVVFTSDELYPQNHFYFHKGHSVRLVKDISNTTPEPPVEPQDTTIYSPTEGIGVFSIGEGKTVTFSRGNLQYTQSTQTWSFAENQYDYLGTANVSNGALADKIDLFGWSASNTTAPFGVSTSTDWENGYSGSFIDWGTNKIGNDAPNTWRTLTRDEWEYLRYNRTNADNLVGVAQVNGVNGLIFLPDNWTCASGVTFKFGFHSEWGFDYYAAYQTFTAAEWSKLEAAGAVFLPASGYRNGSNVSDVQNVGYYWSATELGSYYAYILDFYSDEAGMGYSYRYDGHAVRLIKDVNSTTPEPPVEPEPEVITITHPVDTATICEYETYTWHGNEYNQPGAYTVTEIVEEEDYIYHNIYTLELTVIPFSSDTIVVEAYDSYEWHGMVYTESGTYIYGIYENFCSIEVLELTIIDTPTPPEPEIPTEGIGVFSIGEGKTVTFSRGNLQYTQSTDTWSFAENQWDMIGTDNMTGGSVSSDPRYGDEKYGNALADKIDLFGWSTSTTNFGVSTSTSSSDYSGSFVDWGTNQIDADAPNTWRTLSYDEWNYLCWERPNYSDLCGVAQVNGVNGLIFLPDNWTCPEGVTFKSGFHSNYGIDYYAACQSFTADQWSTLEAAGAVFLPASGSRYGSRVSYVQNIGYYWSASEGDSDYAPCLDFNPVKALMYYDYRYYGKSVRLVKDISNTTPEPPTQPQDTIIYIDHPTEYGAICEGDEFYWRGRQITEAGTHTDHETVKDENYTYHHIYILELSLLLSGEIIEFPTTEVTICENELPYVWNINWHKREVVGAGTYTHEEILDCGGAIYTLELTVIPSEKVVLVEEAYDSYEWHGKVYTESGVYTYRDPYNPCVIEELYLTIIDTPTPPEPQDTTIYHPTEYATICEGETLTWRGMEYTEAGTHIYEEIVEDEDYIYHNIYTLDLTVIPPEIVVLSEEAYDSYEWHGVVYTESGTYLYEEWCFQEILELTIIPSEDKEYVYGTYYQDLVCNGGIYVDPITGENYLISSLVSTSLTWSDTVKGTEVDTIHTFNITPIVSPEPLTEDMLYAIGSVPRLVAGEKVDIAGTTELIMAYYQMVDQHDIADVIGVEWVAGHDVVLDTEQTTHTMVLEVWDECGYRISKEFTFPVSKKDSEPQDTTICIYYTEDVTICEGETLIWMGMEYTETGTYTCIYKEIVEDEDYTYIYLHLHILYLTVLPYETIEYEVEAYDSFEWHGIVYTESGTYTYQYECTTEVLYLTIIPSEDNQGEVVVEPSTNSVTITWQKEDDADTYIIVIKQGDKVVCTLIFDAEGNLVSVNYLPGRESNKHGIQHAGLTSDSFQYTITGLTPSTDYTYTVTATDDSDNTISSYSGEFTTHHATSVENTNSQSPTIDCQKILYEDHIYILRDGKIYSIMGQEM